MDRKLKIGIFFILLIIQAILMIFILINYDSVVSKIDLMLDWINSNNFLSLTIICVVNVLSIGILIPASLVNLLLCYTCVNIFSTVPGMCIALALCFFTNTLGCTLAFFIVKTLIGDQAESCMGKKYRKIKAVFKAVEVEGIKIVILLRIAPLPYSLVNSGLALSSIKFKDFVYGSVGILPKICLAVYLATTIKSFSQGFNQNSPLNIVFYVLGGIAAFSSVIIIAIKARKELEKYKSDENYCEMQEYSVKISE
jgi:uncharacterized membrane protein YdjX (TVP38/TMEM64 family)